MILIWMAGTADKGHSGAAVAHPSRKAVDQMLLFLNLWFVSAALATLRETNRWLAFLSSVQWEQTNNPKAPNSG
jgi:hypothetical protein